MTRQTVVIGATFAAAVMLAQLVDHDPVPTSVVPLLWVAAALTILAQFAGLATLRRFAREHRVLTAAAIATIGGVVAALVLAETPRLSAFRSSPAEAPKWSTVQSTEPPLPLKPAARELYLAMEAASRVEDLAACDALLRPGDSFGPRTRVQIGALVSSPGMMVIPAFVRLRDAVRAMERVPVFRQVNRTPPASKEEQRLVQIYDWMLTRSWFIARERRTPSGERGPEPSVCAYGFADLASKTFLAEYDAALRAIPGT